MIAGESPAIRDWLLMLFEVRNPPHTRRPRASTLFGVSVAACILVLLTGCKGPRDQGVRLGPDHALEYKEDRFGNRIPDYSSAGYKHGLPLPDVPVVLTLQADPDSTDDTARIQKALNAVAQKNLSAEGFRGALLLKKGTYTVSGQLFLNASGVVLRGEGQFKGGSVIWARGTQRRSVITINGADPEQEAYNQSQGNVFRYRPATPQFWEIVDTFIPSGANVVQVAPVRGLAKGDIIILEQRMNQEWINLLRMNDFAAAPNPQSAKPWDPLDYVFQFERTIESIEGGRVHLSAPLVNPVFAELGANRILKAKLPKRVFNAGVEHLRLISEFDSTQGNQDENHAWNAIEIERAADSWIRGVTSEHFGNATVVANRESIRITVEDCAYLKPVARQGFGRRHGFVTQGQQVLMQRCFTEEASHPFASLGQSCGPNVFLDCYAQGENSVIGPARYWSMGTLWDNVQGHRLMIRNRGFEGGGWGWSGINHLFWNCTAFGGLSVQSPINGWNWAIGCKGKRLGSPFQGLIGHVSRHGQDIQPRSLYMQQLGERMGKETVAGTFAESQRDDSELIHTRDTLSR